MQRIALFSVTTAGLLMLAGCAGSDPATAPAPGAAAGAVDLSADCPATVSVQTDWYPEAEHGHLYELLGPEPSIDARRKSVTGPLVSAGQATGINLQIKAGGPAVGYQNVSTQLYQNKDITLGYVGTDEAVQFSRTLPTTAVFAQLNLSPLMIMWDPKTYPEVKDLSQLGAALKARGGVVRYFSGSPYMSFIISKGIFDKSVTDGSYDGTPARFVAGRGKDAQQGFASAEPYIYSRQVPAWNKEVKYALLNTIGWSPYASAVSVRTDQLDSLRGCLTKLVPVLQQGLVDFMADPGPTSRLILELDQAYSKSWPYTVEVAQFAVESMKQNKIVSDGGAGHVGSFDPARMEQMVRIVSPIFAGSRTADPEVKATDLYTNEFQSTTVGLGY
jgi:hypothetical protein